MTTSAGVTTGLELDGVECSPLGGDKLVVRLHGRWPGRPRQAGRRVTLVVEDEGRRHRFPAIPAPRNAPPAADQDAWTASFAVPAWLQPTPETSMSLTIGDANIPVPGPQPSAENGTSAPAAERSDPPVRPAASGNGASRSDSDHPGDGDVRSDSAPISTSDATIAALRAELHQRAGAI